MAKKTTFLGIEVSKNRYTNYLSVVIVSLIIISINSSSDYLPYIASLIVLLTFIVAYIESNTQSNPLIQAFQNDIATDHAIPSSKVISHSTDGIVWLSPLEDSWSIEHFKLIYYIVLVLSIIVLLVFIFFHLGDKIVLWHSLINFKLLSFLFLILAVKKSRINLETKSLGVDEKHLYIKHHDRIYKAKPTSVSYTLNTLFLDTTFVYIGNQLFDMKQQQHYIYPKLRDATYISPLAIVWLRLKNRDGELWLYLVAFISFVISF